MLATLVFLIPQYPPSHPDAWPAMAPPKRLRKITSGFNGVWSVLPGLLGVATRELFAYGCSLSLPYLPTTYQAKQASKPACPTLLCPQPACARRGDSLSLTQ